jgi:hypothetical protein
MLQEVRKLYTMEQSEIYQHHKQFQIYVRLSIGI